MGSPYIKKNFSYKIRNEYFDAIPLYPIAERLKILESRGRVFLKV